MVRYSAFARWLISGLTIFLLARCTATQPVPKAASPAKPFQPGTLALVSIPAPSLANNVLREPEKQQIAIYLPPSYKDSNQRYPVVYHLTALGVPLASPYGYQAVKTAMDHLLGERKAREMIVVIVAGYNSLGGSFYVNSPITGNWQDFIVQDVVEYMDSHYRTLASAASRGISGHSMGGFGALNLAIHHPEIFGAVYSLSPGLFDSQGLADSQMFASPNTVNNLMEGLTSISSLPPDQAENAFRKFFAAAGNEEKFALAYGAAFSPAPDKKPPYILYPYHIQNGEPVRDEMVWKQWESGFGGIAIHLQAFKANLLKLKAIGIEYGQQDEYAWVPRGCQYLSQLMHSARIEHTLLVFQGGHFDKLSQRIEGYMLPFFSKELAFDDQ